MKPITLRNLPADLARRIRQTAEEQNTSANKAVIRLLKDRTGSELSKPTTRHHDLDALAGRWSKGESRAFDRALARQRSVDDDMWK